MDTTKTCPKCGKPLAAKAPAGLCPECLMQAGFPTGTEPDPGTKRQRFQPPPIEELKAHFPQLEILSYIGQGGMGAVYKARQPMLDRYVALKILPPEASSSPGFTERFTREARALARLNHPNIVAVHEFGRSRRGDEAEGGEGYYYLLMEFVDGVNLREMERTQKLAPAQALSIVPKICEALQYAHDEGVVHRDIKPENILVDKKGRVKIADFGIAKILGAETYDRITGTQHVIGTPHYMAPEQVEKPLSVDHRADIYSVGVVFYEMLTGELPLGRFAAPSKKVQIDVRLDEVVLRALEKEPEQRYQQASVFKSEIETVASAPAAPAEPAANDWFSSLQVHWREIAKWALIIFIFLDFLLPHSWHLGGGLRFGVTQPWLFLPHDGNGLIINPRSTSFVSGVVALGMALVLVVTRRHTIPSKYRRWIAAISLALLVAVGARAIVEPFKAVNDAVAPEINPGSTVFVSKIGHTYLPGDIIVYRWFATGYPTKYLLGRVVEGSDYGQIAIERRHQSPQQILLSDVVGKVIFNTHAATAYVRKPETFGPVVERTLNDLATKTNCVLNLITGELLTPPPDVAELLNPMRLYSPSNKPPEYRRIWMTVQKWCRENDAHLIGPVTRTPHLNALGGLAAIVPVQWNISVEDLTNCFFNMDYLPVGSMSGFTMPNAVESRSDNSGTYAFKTVYGAFGLFKILSTNKWPNPSITIQYKLVNDGSTSIASDSQQPNPTNTISRASAEVWAPVPIPTNFIGMSKILDDARNLAKAGEYEKALQRHIWYHDHGRDVRSGGNSVLATFGLTDWADLGEQYPKAKQALIEIRDADVQNLFDGTGTSDTFMDMQSINRSLKDEDRTISVFHDVEKRNPELASHCYFFVQTDLVRRGEYQLCKKCIGDFQARYEVLQRGYGMSVQSAAQMAQLRRQIPVRQFRQGVNIPVPGLPDFEEQRKQTEQDHFVKGVCELVEILLATGSPEKADDILRQAKEVLKNPKFDTAIDDAKQRIEAHKTENHSGLSFFIGQRYFPRGDLIELISVERSANQLVVKGHYTLVSAHRGTLALNITSTNADAGYTAVAPQQSKRITSGHGDFELIHLNAAAGLPHIAMYGDDGVAFANLYFGTKEEADRESRLDLKTEFSARTAQPQNKVNTP